MYYRIWVVDKLEALGLSIKNRYGLYRLLLRKTNHVINKVNLSDRSACAALRRCSQDIVVSINGIFSSFFLSPVPVTFLFLSLYFFNFSQLPLNNISSKQKSCLLFPNQTNFWSQPKMSEYIQINVQDPFLLELCRK